MKFFFEAIEVIKEFFEAHPTMRRVALLCVILAVYLFFRFLSRAVSAGIYRRLFFVFRFFALGLMAKVSLVAAKIMVLWRWVVSRLRRSVVCAAQRVYAAIETVCHALAYFLGWIGRRVARFVGAVRQWCRCAWTAMRVGVCRGYARIVIGARACWQWTTKVYRLSMQDARRMIDVMVLWYVSGRLAKFFFKLLHHVLGSLFFLLFVLYLLPLLPYEAMQWPFNVMMMSPRWSLAQNQTMVILVPVLLAFLVAGMKAVSSRLVPVRRSVVSRMARYLYEAEIIFLTVGMLVMLWDTTFRNGGIAGLTVVVGVGLTMVLCSFLAAA